MAAPMMESRDEAVIVTGARADVGFLAMKAAEEALGDLKLYRVPERVTVAAKSLKQVAFLDQDAVEGRLVYLHRCPPREDDDQPVAAGMLLVTVNDKRHGLGMALPMGGLALFEPSAFGEQLVAEDRLRDYAEGQDVELGLGESSQVFGQCSTLEDVDFDETPQRWMGLRTMLTNANPNPVTVRVVLGPPSEWRFRGVKGARLKDGEMVVELAVPGNGQREVRWDLRPAAAR
jgi:hypothetical protein